MQIFVPTDPTRGPVVGSEPDLDQAFAVPTTRISFYAPGYESYHVRKDRIHEPHPCCIRFAGRGAFSVFLSPLCGATDQHTAQALEHSAMALARGQDGHANQLVKHAKRA